MAQVRISYSDFSQRLFYACEKSRDHAFAFWKLCALAREGETWYLPEAGFCYAVYRGLLFACISSDGSCPLPAEELNRFECIHMRGEMFGAIRDKLRGFDPSYGYKLHYDFSHVAGYSGLESWEASAFDFSNQQHFVQASRIISQQDEGWMKPDNILKIMREPVFDPCLWFFARDRASGEVVGIAISTYDPGLRETDLEWVYVLPGHQGKGAGRFLVEETMRRSLVRSKDIRVGGTNEFYKKCGFVEKEQTVWAPRKGYSLIAPCIQPNLLP